MPEQAGDQHRPASVLVNAQVDAQRLLKEGADTWGAKTAQSRRSAPVADMTPRKDGDFLRLNKGS